MTNTETYKIVATTLAGLENVLADELKCINAREVETLTRAVSFTGNKELMYKANFWCRTALKILKPIKYFSIADESAFYNEIYKINWEEYLSVDDTLQIDCVTNNSFITHSKYAAQKAKDAVVDRFRHKFNKRPSVDLENSTLRINIHLSNNNCTVSLDSSGDVLYKRGYKIASFDAPINEVLAAGMILLSCWDKKCNFIDPMCGSGTILIEAALIANNIPPGYYRRRFGFEKWKDFDKELWEKIKNDSLSEQTEFENKIFGSDISERSISIAEKNIKYAKLHKDIELRTTSFEDSIASEEGGIMITNPPYDERMKKEDINGFYKSLGDTLKKKYDGFDAWIISSNFEALKSVGLKPSKKIPLFNGPLECKFVKFEIYKGSR
ncbi:MAG: THUMP domain-containing protein, partial [Bacteroidales bacterium]|nr:THUMP domain-containing protein [Bacteroidales bacterium]